METFALWVVGFDTRSTKLADGVFEREAFTGCTSLV
jgi:hypothetical protein